jgi:hypothetical protein
MVNTERQIATRCFQPLGPGNDDALVGLSRQGRPVEGMPPLVYDTMFATPLVYSDRFSWEPLGNVG